MRFAFNNFVLDPEQRVLWKEGEAVPLSPKVFETLDLLVRSEGRIVTKQEFMAALWPDSFVEDGNLTQNIFVLRKILGHTDDGRPYIETFPRRGYRFVGVVRKESRIDSGDVPEKVSTLADEKNPAPPTLATLIDESEHQGEMQQRSLRVAKPRLPLSSIAIGAFVLLLSMGCAFALHWKARMKVGGYQRLTNDGRSKDLHNTPSIITVGKNALYLTEIDGGRSVLAQVPLEGGEVSYSQLPPNLHSVELGRDGQGALLLGSQWPIDESLPLFSRDLSTGADSPVLGLRAHDASWSPDSQKLAYTQLGKLFVRSQDGATVQVASVEGIAYWPRWSPDGRTIRFSESYQGFHDRLWQVDSSGGDLHKLFPNQTDSEHMCCGSWTKTGRGFVYLSIQTNNSKIHLRSEAGSAWDSWPPQSIDISAAPLDRWAGPVPSADGRHIFAIGEQLHGQLVRIDPVTRRPEPFIGGISAEGVSFSPDHTNIVWTAYPEGTLWRSQSDGSGRVQLTQAPIVARFPHWSPNGAMIVFTAARPGSDWQLYTVPAKGGEMKLLTDEPRGQGVATWSPDGKALAFGHILDVVEARKQPLDIEIFHLSDRSSVTIPGSEGLWTARWSPDGRYLSAVTEDNQTLRIYDMQTKTWSDLAHSNVNDVIWSSDSKSLFFDAILGTDQTLYRVRLSDRKVERWASLNGIRRAGFFAPWLGIAPDGAPILLEDTSIQELYSISVNLP